MRVLPFRIVRVNPECGEWERATDVVAAVRSTDRMQCFTRRITLVNVDFAQPAPKVEE